MQRARRNFKKNKKSQKRCPWQMRRLRAESPTPRLSFLSTELLWDFPTLRRLCWNLKGPFTVLFGHLWVLLEIHLQAGDERQSPPSCSQGLWSCPISLSSWKLESQRGFWCWRSISLGFLWELNCLCSEVVDSLRWAETGIYNKNTRLLKESVFIILELIYLAWKWQEFFLFLS